MIKNTEAESLHSLDSLLSRRQVADLFGVSTRTIRRMERRGQLDPIRVSSRLVRYAASQVGTLIKNSGDAA